MLLSFNGLSISGDGNVIDINLKLSEEFENLNISQEFKDIKDQNSNDEKNEEDLSFLLDIPHTVALNMGEILTPSVCLAYDHINKFGEILNSQFGFQHLDVFYLQFPHCIQEIPKLRSNLQILFSGNCGSGSIGHWIFSYYN